MDKVCEFSSIFCKSLKRIGVNSLNIWYSLPVKPSGLGFFLCWEVLITDSIFYLLKICSDFLFLLLSVLVVSVFLGIYPFHLGYPVC